MTIELLEYDLPAGDIDWPGLDPACSHEVVPHRVV